MIAAVLGAGINGLTAAIELRRRGHDVILVDPGPIPHPLAASNDISKAVRAAYGADEDYTELADRAIADWSRWNAELGEQLYHQTGSLFLCREEMRTGTFECESFISLQRHGHSVERIRSEKIRQRFPAWNAESYVDGFFDPDAGYAESGRVVSSLAKLAVALGVVVRQNASFSHLEEAHGRVRRIVLSNGESISADKVVAALGAWTPFVLPFLQTHFRTTAQPVFHLRPSRPELFTAEIFPFFGADISRTGYYGFPINRDGIVKVANHGPGRAFAPSSIDRAVTAGEENQLREFLRGTFPALAAAPIVHAHVCLYCDTVDGNFWIAEDPDRAGLIVAAGDNGHGFKFAPVLGQIIADVVEEKPNPLAHKFRWRTGGHAQREAARYDPDAIA